MITQPKLSTNLDAIAPEEQAFCFGQEDALAGKDQRGSRYFIICSTAWSAYNDGYAQGCNLLHSLTGSSQPCWRGAL